MNRMMTFMMWFHPTTDGINILDVDTGAICKVAFGGQYYRAKVIETGMFGISYTYVEQNYNFKVEC